MCVLSHFFRVQRFVILVDCSPSGFSVHGILQARILEEGCHALLQGIFPTQESNTRLLHLLHWQAGSLPLAPPGKPLETYTQSHICLKFAIYSWEVAGGGRSLSLQRKQNRQRKAALSVRLLSESLALTSQTQIPGPGGGLAVAGTLCLVDS